MSLLLNENGEILYHGQVIGRMQYSVSTTTVELNIRFSGLPDEVVIPLSKFAQGLAYLDAASLPADAFEIETAEDSAEPVQGALQLLVEKTVKGKNFVWRFHKSDVDLWPSGLHGHDYERGLKLDAIDGQIYDTSTRQCVKKLKRRELENVQGKLRASSDFAAKVKSLIDDAS